MSTKKLYKSRDKKISGVCGGIANYLDFDPTVVRLVWALVGLTTGVGFVGYIVAAIIMEDEPSYRDDVADYVPPKKDGRVGFCPDNR